MSEHLTKAKNALEHAKREEDPKARIRLIDIAHVQAAVALAETMQGILEHLDGTAAQRKADATIKYHTDRFREMNDHAS